MKHPRVVLVFPQMTVYDIQVEAATSTVFPIGLALIAAMLEGANIPVSVIDMVAEELTIEGLVRRVAKIKPDIVGITATTVTYPRTRQIVCALKTWRPNLLVVLGGPHASLVRDQLLRDTEADVVVIGEGEHAMVEIAQAYRDGGGFDGIAGICFRSGGKIVATPRRPFIKDLDSLPFPAVHHFAPRVGRLAERYPVYPVCTGRGCTYACSFCGAAALSGRAYRIRSPENVVAEMAGVARQYGMDQFFFVDDTFTAVSERTYKLCELIAKELPGSHWICECRTNCVSRHLLRTMAEAGCYKLQFGIESGNQQILNGVQKGTTLEQIEEEVRNAFECGIEEVIGSFIVGLPGESLETAMETVAFSIKLKGVAEETARRLGARRQFGAFITSLVPFPKTRCTTEAEALGIRVLKNGPADFISDGLMTCTNGLSAKEIRELVMVGELFFHNVGLPGLNIPGLAKPEPVALAS